MKPQQVPAPEPGAVGGGTKKKRKNKKKKKNEDEVANQNPAAGLIEDMEEDQTPRGRIMMIVRDGGEMYEEY